MSLKSALALALAASTLAARPSHSATRAAEPAGKPAQLTAGKVALQALGGLGGGLAGSAVGFAVGTALGSIIYDSDPLGRWAGGAIGAYSGYSLGSVVGISWVGRKQGLRGSPWLAAAGNLAGQALAFWIAEELYDSPSDALPVFLGLPAAMGLAAYDGSHLARSAAAGPWPRDPAGGKGPSGPVYRLQLLSLSF